MMLGDLTDLLDPWSDSGSAGVPTDGILAPGVVSTIPGSDSTWNWSSFFQGFFPFASNVYAQQQQTQRVQTQVNAAASQPTATIAGIPVTTLLIGAALFVMVKK